MKLDFSKHILIEASAGTGKTFSIVEIVSNFIENNIPLNKLAVLTFTEKAAGELKDRIREKLNSNNSSKSTESISILPNAMIGTIHQFCRNLIKKYAFYLNFSIYFIEIEDDKNHINEFFKIFWNRIEKEDSRELIELIKFLGFSNYKNILIEMYFKSNNHLIQIDDSTKETELQNLFHEAKSFFKNLNLKNDKSQTFNKLLQFISEIKDDFSNEDFFRLIQSNLLTKENSLNSNIEKYLKKITEFDFSNLISNLVKLNNEILIQKYADLLSKDFNRFCSDYQSYKQKRDEVSKDDLILFAMKLTENEKLKKELQDIYSYIILDECQDSNKLQIQLLQNIFKNKKKGLVYVGDIKQSIYRFRGADIDSYQNSILELERIGLEKKVLETSYRSTNSLVQYFNHHFCKFNSFIQLYTQVKASKERIQNEFTKKSVLILDPELDSNENKSIRQEKEFLKVYELIELITENEEYQIYDKISKKFREIELSDIAILSPKTNSLEYIQKELVKKKIPANRYKSSDFYSNHIIISLIQILYYIENPENTKALFQALNSDLFLISEIELLNFQNKLNQENSKADLVQKRLLDFHKQRFIKPASIILYDLISQFEIFERISIGVYGNRNLTNVYHLIDLISETEITENLTFGEVVKKFHSKINSDEEEILKLESDKKNENYKSIQCMTIHASKGLEFPVCILFDLHSEIGRSTDNFFFEEKDQNLQFHFRYNKLETKDFSYAKEKNSVAENKELERLIYVAMTRAKDYLVYSKNLIPKNKFAFIFESLDLSLEEIQTNFESKKNKKLSLNKNENLVIEKKFKEINISKNNFQNQKGYKIVSFSSLHEKSNQEILDKAKFAENSLVQINNEKKELTEHKKENEASNFGLYCHKVLEEFPLELLNGTEDNIRKKVSSLVDELKNDYLIGNSENYNHNLVEEYVFSTLTKEYPIDLLNEKYIRLKDIDILDRERKFYFPLESKNADLLVGVGDGMFSYQNKYYILDWKTNMIKDKNISEIVNETYLEQCLIYSLNLLSNFENPYSEHTYEKFYGGMLFIFLRETKNKEGTVFLKPSLKEILEFQKSLK